MEGVIIKKLHFLTSVYKDEDNLTGWFPVCDTLGGWIAHWACFVMAAVAILPLKCFPKIDFLLIDSDFADNTKNIIKQILGILSTASSVNFFK